MKYSKILSICAFSVLSTLSPLQALEDLTNQAEGASGKSVEDKAVVVSEVSMGWTTQAVLSTYVGDNHAEGYIDLLIPLLQGDDGMIFLYPRFGLHSDVDPGYSMGLGARHYIASIDAIIGGNIFYDRYDSAAGNYYDQIGLGVEVLTRWVDARFNYYIPDSSPNVIDNRRTRSRSQSSTSSWGQPFATGYTIRQPYTTTTTTTTVNQLFERFEDTMEGLDAEIGVLTPWLEQYVALRWFAGYYNFNNSYGSDLSGVKARAELRFSQKLAIDATYYEDEEVTGSNWLFGFRMSIPVYMENLSDGRSPFEGSFSGMFDGVNLGGRGRGASGILRSGVGSTYPSGYAAISPFAAMAPSPTFAAASTSGSTVRDRMTEQVLRLSGARTSESDFIENLAERDVDVDVDTLTRIVVIDPSVVFVSNTGGTVGGLGTYENPLNTIQGGVNRASALFGNAGDVVVAGTGTQYVEDVMDVGSSVRVWGGGRGYPVNGGRRFTYGSQPVLDGGFLIDNTPAFLLSGFTVMNGHTTGDGVYVENVGEVDILWNTILNTSEDGIDLEYDGANQGNIRVVGNSVMNAGDDALDFDFDGPSVAINLLVDRNQLFNSGSDGMEFDIESGSVVTALITNNLINGTSGEGLEIDQDNNSSATMRILSNTIINSGSDPLDIDLEDMSFGRYQVARNVFSSMDPPAVDNIDIDTRDMAILNLQIFGNTSSQNFNFDEDGVSTFLLEDTLGTNVLTGGAVFDIDPNIMPYVPFGSFGFPAP